MTAWADLISKLQILDDLAKKIQKPTIFSGQNPSEGEIETFRTEYQEWYTDCLSILEGELKTQFELAYRAHANSFILHPTDFHKAGERYGSRSTYQTNQFKFPYSSFHKAVYEHRTILLQAGKMQNSLASKTQVEAIEDIKNTTYLKPVFNHAALKYLANIIEERFRIDFWGNGIKSLLLPNTREIDDFFKRAGFNVDSLNASEGAIYKWLKDIQKLSNGHDKIFQLVMQLCDPLEYFEEEEKHDAILNKVNQVLQQYGRIAHKNGQILLKGREAEIFDSRMFHPELAKYGRTHFIEGRYFHTVIECCKSLEKRVREKAKLNIFGKDLMSTALSPKTGCLRLNELQTLTETNEQEGLMHLCMGLMQAIRNPGSHEPEIDRQMTKEDALEQLSLISYLYRQIEQTKYTAPEKAIRHS